MVLNILENLLNIKYVVFFLKYFLLTFVFYESHLIYVFNKKIFICFISFYGTHMDKAFNISA